MHVKLTHLVVSIALIQACDRATPRSEDAPPPRTSKLSEIEKAGAPEWDRAFRHAARWDAAQRAVVVDVDVAPGFHAYTQGETIGKPLALEVEAKLAGEVVYPKGTVKDLPVGRSMIVEGKSAVVAPIADPQPGQDVRGTFRWQVCTAEACDRPRSAPVAVTVPAS